MCCNVLDPGCTNYRTVDADSFVSHSDAMEIEMGKNPNILSQFKRQKKKKSGKKRLKLPNVAPFRL